MTEKRSDLSRIPAPLPHPCPLPPPPPQSPVCWICWDFQRGPSLEVPPQSWGTFRAGPAQCRPARRTCTSPTTRGRRAAHPWGSPRGGAMDSPAKNSWLNLYIAALTSHYCHNQLLWVVTSMRGSDGSQSCALILGWPRKTTEDIEHNESRLGSSMTACTIMELGGNTFSSKNWANKFVEEEENTCRTCLHLEAKPESCPKKLQNFKRICFAEKVTEAHNHEGLEYFQREAEQTNKWKRGTFALRNWTNHYKWR